METVGQRLKKQRESRGVDLAVAAKATKIRPERLREMEEDNFSKIDGLSYQREFLRTYAKYLRLDPHELVAEFNEQFGYEEEDYGAISSKVPVRPVAAASREVKLKPMVVLYSLVSLVILLVLLPVIVNLWRIGYFNLPFLPNQQVVVADGEKDELKGTGVEPAVSESATNGVTTNPPPAAATSVVEEVTQPVVKNRLAIRALDDCWVRITLDGQVDENDGGFILTGGTQREFEAGKFTVEVFNPSLVMMLYNGQEVVGANQGTDPKTFNLP